MHNFLFDSVTFIYTFRFRFNHRQIKIKVSQFWIPKSKKTKNNKQHRTTTKNENFHARSTVSTTIDLFDRNDIMKHGCNAWKNWNFHCCLACVCVCAKEKLKIFSFV